jgi:hypothetical protein
MSLQDEIRQDLAIEVFNEFGKSVQLVRKGSITYNARGEEEDSVNTTTTITAVPYNIIESRQSYQPFGEMNAGDLDMAVPWDRDIRVKDLVIIDGVTYEVKEVSKNFLPDNVVTIVRLARTVPITSDEVVVEDEEEE